MPVSSDFNLSPRKHAATTAPDLRPDLQLDEPTNAERVRTLLSAITVGTLSTLSRKHPGYPFGSLMPFALDAAGCPLLLISTMAMHTQNLQAEPRSSLFVGQPANSEDALGSARVTLVGEAKLVAGKDLESAREQYLSRHESSRYWVDFADFHFYCLQPIDIYYVGGFGVMGWVEAEAYKHASPDPLAPSAARILSHMNADHVEALLALAQKHTGLTGTEAAMTSIDRLGFALRVKTEQGMKGARINFPRQVTTTEQARAVLVEMTRAASGA